MAAQDQSRAVLDDWFEAQRRLWELWLGPAAGDDQDENESRAKAGGAAASDGDGRAAAAADAWAGAAGDAVRAWTETVTPLARAMAELMAAGAEGGAKLFEASVGAWHAPADGAGPDWAAAATAYAESIRALLLGPEPPWTQAGSGGLRRFLDATWGSWGSWEKAFGRAVEGPSLGQPNRAAQAMARAARAWAELGRAAAEYQAIVADGWANAWAEFLAVLPSRPPSTVRQMLRLWGTTADNVLTELFATETYSRAQGRLVNAAIAYRLAEGEVADLFLEAAHMPTRRQLDDANRAIHDLRREVRSLRREVRG